MTTCMQWAPPTASTVPRLFDRLARLRLAQGWLLVLFSLDVAALIDLVTGPDLWCGPIYLLVVCIAAWSLGWKAGQLTGIGCMGITLAINGLGLYPHGDTGFAWNLLLRFGALSILVAIIAGVRRAYVREWWLARTDPLTGAMNRQAFFELAPSAIDSSRWRLLVYADLDGLKKVNDAQGHAAGDTCLRAFGSAVSGLIRRHDIFARLGGDEFVIYMSVKNEAAAETVAARLHRAMNGIPTEHGTLSCSVGGLVVPPGDVSMDNLVRRADDLMYKAKLRGACLQMGAASDVVRQKRGPARAVPRNVSLFVGRNAPTERRAHPEAVVEEAVPR